MKTRYGMFSKVLTFPISASLLLGACNVQNRVDPNSVSGGGQTSGGQTTEPFVPQKVDVVFAIDSANMTADAKAQALASIQSVLQQLSSANVNYQAAFLNTNFSPLTQNAGVNSLLQLGNLIPIGGANYLNSSTPLTSIASILANTAFGQATNQMGGGNYQQLISTLLPIVMTAASHGSQGATQQQIMDAIAPLLQNALQNGVAGGNYSSLVTMISPIVASIASGGAQKMNFQELVAAALPLAISAATASSGGQGASYAAMALPIVLRILEAQKSNQKIDMASIMAMALPIITANLSKTSNQSQSQQTQQLIATILPIAVAFINNLQSGKTDTHQLIAGVMPIVMSLIAQYGGTNSNAALVSAAIPIISSLISGGNLASFISAANNPLSAISNPQLLAILSALNGQNGLKDFLRPDALLSVVMLSNIGKVKVGGVDASALAESLISSLAQIKGGQSQDVILHTLLQTATSSQCSQSSSVPLPSTGDITVDLFAAIAVASGGQNFDLCSASGLATTLIDQLTHKH